MRRLEQLLQSNLVCNNDLLYFFFKKNRFSCEITTGGLLWKCSWQKPGSSTVTPLFRNTATLDGRPYIKTFESLTDWTETCIQECLDEYHTRYSSWKRVRHERLDQPMEIIYKHLQEKKLGKEPVSEINCSLYEQIAALTDLVEQTQSQVRLWEQWFVTNHPGQTIPIASIIPKEPEPITVELSETQPFVLNSAEGQYMVLHRLNEVAPTECMEWLKSNGSDHYQTLLKEVKERVIFDPVIEAPSNWSPVDVNSAKLFVHQFFS